MARSRPPRRHVPDSLPKTPTGITGLDEVTLGGLPRGRTTLVIGGPGCGKTLLGIEFLVRGALDFDEPGAFVAFEETAEDLNQNVRSLGYELDALVAAKKLVLDHIRVERSEIEETGDYDLEGLFVRLAHAIDSIGAKRLVIDTLEVLFSSLKDHGVVRSELRRLFAWLKDRGITAIVTAERGPNGELSRHGIEEYVSDCVIAFDHRVSQQVSTRRLRVVKYRGTSHGANEYPFLIDEGGLVVFPITSLGLDYPAPQGLFPAGIKGLDAALDGRGFHARQQHSRDRHGGHRQDQHSGRVRECRLRPRRALPVLCDGRVGGPDRAQHALHRLNLQRWRQRGLLRLQSARPTLHGLETHLAIVYKAVAEFQPKIVVMDPLTNLVPVGSDREVTAVVTRLIDFLKSRQITALFTSLASIHADPEHSEVGVSSWMDTWLLLRTLESQGIRRRALYVIKSRGMAHSDGIHELRFTARGISGLRRRRRPEAVTRNGKPRQGRDAGSCGFMWPGRRRNAWLAFANLKKICEEYLTDQYDIEIIDLLQTPALAQGDQILAIPTLVRKLPEPVRQIIGDLSNTERVLVGLDIRPVARSREREIEANWQKCQPTTPELRGRVGRCSAPIAFIYSSIRRRSWGRAHPGHQRPAATACALRGALPGRHRRYLSSNPRASRRRSSPSLRCRATGRACRKIIGTIGNIDHVASSLGLVPNRGKRCGSGMPEDRRNLERKTRNCASVWPRPRASSAPFDEGISMPYRKQHGGYRVFTLEGAGLSLSGAGRVDERGRDHALRRLRHSLQQSSAGKLLGTPAATLPGARWPLDRTGGCGAFEQLLRRCRMATYRKS